MSFSHPLLKTEHVKTHSILGISQIDVKVHGHLLSIANTFGCYRVSL